MRIFRHAPEVFLEGKTDLTAVAAGCRNLRHRLCHRVYGTMIRAPVRQIRIKSVAHHSHRVTVASKHRKLRNHSLCLCRLISAAVRHEYGRRPDGAVEHLYKTFLGAYIQIA